jgi:hypothetical protein
MQGRRKWVEGREVQEEIKAGSSVVGQEAV